MAIIRVRVAIVWKIPKPLGENSAWTGQEDTRDIYLAAIPAKVRPGDRVILFNPYHPAGPMLETSWRLAGFSEKAHRWDTSGRDRGLGIVAHLDDPVTINVPFARVADSTGATDGWQQGFRYALCGPGHRPRRFVRSSTLPRRDLGA